MDRVLGNPRRPFRQHRQPLHGFTLIELLACVAIIAALLALLMPSLRAAIHTARIAVCQSNLHQLHVGTMSYAADNLGCVPDMYTLGGWAYRRAPGLSVPGDTTSLPETFGMAALYDRLDYVDGHSRAWVCPDQNESMTSFANTYAFTLLRTHGATGDPSRHRLSRLMAINTNVGYNRQGWLWDNAVLYPGLPGMYNEGFSGYTVPTAIRYYPHTDYGYSGFVATNILFIDGGAYRHAYLP